MMVVCREQNRSKQTAAAAAIETSRNIEKGEEK